MIDFNQSLSLLERIDPQYRQLRVTERNMFANSQLCEADIQDAELSTDKMKATTEWMAQKYDEMNNWLFGGELDGCNFEIFTKGRGSQGRTLGLFRLSADGLKANRQTRRIFQENYYSGNKTFITKDNFYNICRPVISLNGNYSGTEKSLLTTLVHEMCHYYTYMYGLLPKQGHGIEFKYIANVVSSRSNGLFTIQRLASAEQMSGYELDDEMKMRREKRLNNKKNNAIAVFVFRKDNMFELTITTNEQLVKKIIDLRTENSHGSRLSSSDIVKIITSNDGNLIGLLFNYGYNKTMRTYRYWEIKTSKFGGEDFIENGGYDFDVVYKNIDDRTSNDNLSKKETQEKEDKHIFSIKSTNGEVNIAFDGTEEDLKNKLKKRFPSMSEESIYKIMSNKANYKMTENKNTNDIDLIIEKTIKDFVNSQSNNELDIAIPSNLNLGLVSPLETI